LLLLLISLPANIKGHDVTTHKTGAPFSQQHTIIPMAGDWTLHGQLSRLLSD